ncbi:zinc-binding dehydrogenase [Streptomyces sp. NPDC048441]
MHGDRAAAAEGQTKVQVEALPLDQAAEAHRRIESGSTTGKLVLTVGGQG